MIDPGAFFVLRIPAPGHFSPRALPPLPYALLDALEVPDRYVAAHFCLISITQEAPEDVDTFDVTPLPGGWMCHNYFGLRVELKPTKVNGGGVMVVRSVTRYATEQRIRPGQLPYLRTRWHELLDEPAAGLRYRWCAAATAALPALWLAARTRRVAVRRRRARRGLCPGCGYDLRATRRCSECGAKA